MIENDAAKVLVKLRVRRFMRSLAVERKFRTSIDRNKDREVKSGEKAPKENDLQTVEARTEEKRIMIGEEVRNEFQAGEVLMGDEVLTGEEVLVEKEARLGQGVQTDEIRTEKEAQIGDEEVKRVEEEAEVGKEKGVRIEGREMQIANTTIPVEKVAVEVVIETEGRRIARKGEDLKEVTAKVRPREGGMKVVKGFAELCYLRLVKVRGPYFYLLMVEFTFMNGSIQSFIFRFITSSSL